jgi:hypothetical protein
MTRKLLVLRGIALLAALLAVYALLSMLTQAMLGGHSADQVWWARVYAWWVDFLTAGLLGLLSVYLWRRAQRTETFTPARPRARRRAFLFPLAYVFLTACLYFADFASYIRGGSPSRSSLYGGIAIACAAVSMALLWSAHRSASR